MFESGGIYMIIGVIVGLFSIGISVYYVHKLFKNSTQQILIKFILLIFTALVALYIVDKIIAFKIELVSEEQSKELFDLIKNLVLMIFSYYFGTKSEK